MDNAQLIGLSRLVVLSRELDVVANNLANINTTGYKTDNSVFAQFMMPEASADAFPTGNRNLAFVQDRAIWHNFNPGPLLRTGGPLDVRVFDGLERLIRDQVMSMKTTFTPGHYRRRVAGVLARRLVLRLFEAA